MQGPPLARISRRPHAQAQNHKNMRRPQTLVDLQCAPGIRGRRGFVGHRRMWAAPRMLRNNNAPQGFLDAEASWAPDASICGYISVVGPKRSWTPNVPQGFVDVEAPWASHAFGQDPGCSRTQSSPKILYPEAYWAPDASICGYLSVRGPRTVVNSERIPTIRGCRIFVGSRRSWTPKMPQGFVDAEAQEHRGPQPVVGQARITQATFSCLSALYSMLMPGQRSAPQEINAARNRNVGISPFKVSIGQPAQIPQTFENLNA